MAEVAVTAERIRELGVEQGIFGDLLYCQAVINEDKPGPFALALHLHGAGGRGNDNRSQLKWAAPQLIEYARLHGEKLIVLAPQCPEDCKWVNVPWDDMEHLIPEEPSVNMALAMKLLDSKIAEFAADPARIYVTGISMGGYGAWDIASRRPELFAAVLSICGGGDTECAARLKNIPCTLWHGDKDDTVPVYRSQSMYKALLAAGNTQVTYHEVPGVYHNVWENACLNDATWEWLLAQKK